MDKNKIVVNKYTLLRTIKVITKDENIEKEKNNNKK